MIDVNQLRKGTTFLVDNDIWKVMNYSHHKPGRGNATIRLQVRNMRSGTIREMTYNSGERVQDIEVEKRSVEYLYGDEEGLTFMDLETYEISRTCAANCSGMMCCISKKGCSLP
jgi:elongation factor P